ncbi:S-adenosyl-L-methionine-dependent methyltransferase [Crucibulum laeve]|uniref:Arsenite methyltransferase n=1 Tax=Crucibulum laeve TaxID=68775 RepID=A0A5C3LM69_9AGAR|nr:S-adenosyl-L-methionine-dependent methyltransferase [Crucibulum laeve]
MSCCSNPSQYQPSNPISDNDIVKAVNDAYSAKAKVGTTTTYAKNVAESFGYTEEELKSIPDEAHLGLSCGNPVATANIKEGEVVLDLGSSGGIDVFLAASKVGPTGQAIGLDMSTDMINLARKNANKQNLLPPRVSFVQTLLTEDLPVVSDSVDVILSNCVINLLPLAGKAKVLKEAHRVLKPGGRIVLDDIVAKEPLPENVRNDLSAYVGCISGAIELNEYKKLLEDAGFKNSLFVDTKSNLNVYYTAGSSTDKSTIGCCSPAPKSESVNAPPSFDANLWVASYQIYATKEGTPDPNAEKLETALLRSWDAYPRPQSTPAAVTADEIAKLVRDASKTPSDFAVIDVRRNDYAGGHVRGSHQHAAQTFYDNLSAFTEKFGKTNQVIFYCQSSNGRGPRCAAWYQDYLNQIGNEESTAYVLQGGIKGWLSKFGGQNDLIDRD